MKKVSYLLLIFVVFLIAAQPAIALIHDWGMVYSDNRDYSEGLESMGNTDVYRMQASTGVNEMTDTVSLTNGTVSGKIEYWGAYPSSDGSVVYEYGYSFNPNSYPAPGPDWENTLYTFWNDANDNGILDDPGSASSWYIPEGGIVQVDIPEYYLLGTDLYWGNILGIDEGIYRINAYDIVDGVVDYNYPIFAEMISPTSDAMLMLSMDSLLNGADLDSILIRLESRLFANNTDTSYMNRSRAYFIASEASAPVPEPSTIILLGVGLAGLAGLGRKKFKK